MPVRPEREYRAINMQQIEARANDAGLFIVEGYATTFDQPYLLFEEDGYAVYEEIAPQAFDGCDMADVIFQYDHQGRVFARTRNNTLQLAPDDHGLHIRADLGGTDIGRQLWQEISGGYTDRMSFGFIVERDQQTQEQAEGRTLIRRRITAFKKLFDVSAVSLPANPATDIYSARGYGEGAIAAARQEIAAQQARERKLKQIQILTEVMKP